MWHPALLSKAITQRPRTILVEVMTATMTTTVQDNNAATDAMASLARQHAASGPDWLRAWRVEAADAFARIGWPTTKDEDWLHTNVKPIATTSFVAADQAEAQVSADLVHQFEFPQFEASLLVFVNGKYAADLSTPPGDVKVLPLSQAVVEKQDLLQPLLTGVCKGEGDAFAHLNNAFLEDGVVIHVPRNQAVDKPIRLMHIAVPGQTPFMTHPRNVIIAEEGADVTVIERYVSTGEGVYLTNAVTQIVAGDNAHVSHYLLEQESLKAYHVSSLHMHLGRDTRVQSHSVLLGGAIVRNNVSPVLDGEGGDCLINGLYNGNGSQHLDNHMHVEHAKPHCDSRQFYQGILDDTSQGVFTGRVVVQKPAQKTDAKQTNANLLLKDTAEIYARPQLEIYADDVKCTHGATIGQIDEDALFYLRSRGIPADVARAMMVFAFAGECLERMSVEPIREALTRELLTQLPHGDVIAEIL